MNDVMSDVQSRHPYFLFVIYSIGVGARSCVFVGMSFYSSLTLCVLGFAYYVDVYIIINDGKSKTMKTE